MLLQQLKLQNDSLLRHYELAGSQPVDNITFLHKERKLISFSSWDILGLGANPSVKLAAHKAINLDGIGCFASRYGLGGREVHQVFEHRLAEFFGAESCLLFSSRVQAIFSLITILCSECDVILVEDANPLPLADAAYLVGANLVTLKNFSANKVTAELQKLKSHQLAFVILETISGVSSNPIDSSQIFKICNQFGSTVIADDSFAFLSSGVRGAGIRELVCNSAEKIIPPTSLLCTLVDLGLVLGAQGAAVVGPKILTDYIINRSRSLKLETPSSPAVLSAALVALDCAELDYSSRSIISGHAARFIREIKELGFKTQAIEGLSSFVCFECASAKQAEELEAHLWSRGFHVEQLSFSSMLVVNNLIRVVFSRHHSQENVSELLSAISDFANKQN